ncbi:MAG: cytochrome c oxidase accessory protein CcoG [Bdellovibrionales bacterium]
MSQAITYFKKQERIYPREVKGRYRKLKWIAMGILLSVYYLTPWLRWNRGPQAPDQAILIDMPARRAWFFDIEIWPQEVYYIAGILILSAVGLFLVTSLFGRVWCGYACPQTVWTDLFVQVERWLQGDRNARIKRDKGPLTLDKAWRKTATHILWILIALLTGGAWVFYFNDAPTLAAQFMRGEIPFGVACWIGGLTFATYLMAGYAREQVCTYMCPYARFQSAMFDRDTLIISYDAARGEPRGSHKKGETWEGRGHCVDCKECVTVCPTGIDIRDGLQLQCIACGLCVDACNGVMERVGLPRGLIRYDTEGNQIERSLARAERRPFSDRLRVIRPRAVYYALILAVVGSVMAHSLLTRATFELHVLHDRNPLVVQLSSGAVRNSYTLKILNKAHDIRHYALTVEGLPYEAKIDVIGAGAPDPVALSVPPDSIAQYRVTITLPEELARQNSRRELDISIADLATMKTAHAASVFIAKE